MHTTGSPQASAMVVTRLHIFGAIVLILFGMLILLASLVATNRSLVGYQHSFSAGRMYFDKPLLPDHPFYPALMVRDRAVLWIADEERALFLRVRYAEERRLRAEQLMQQGQVGLAVTTFSKSQKYLLQAARQSLELTQFPGRTQTHTPDFVRSTMAENLDKSLWLLEDFRASAQGQDHALLTMLSEETKQVRELLRQHDSAVE